MSPKTVDELWSWIAFEPVDEVTRMILEKKMQTYFPGAYSITIKEDKSGFDLTWHRDQDRSLWILKHGPIHRA